MGSNQLLLSYKITAGGGGGSMPSWVTSQSLWTWFDVPNSTLSSAGVNQSPTPSYSATGPSSRIDTWCGATLKRSGSIYIIAASGGHSDYSGNEVIALNLNSESPGWSVLKTASANATIYDQTEVYSDNRRAATHTYYATQFLQSQNRVVIMPSPGMFNSGAPSAPGGFQYPDGTGLVCSFSLSTNDWEAIDTVARPVNGGAGGGIEGDFTAQRVCANPSTDEIFLSRYGATNGRAWKYNPNTNSWAATNSVYQIGYGGAAVDFTRNRMLCIGNYDGDMAPQVYNWDTLANLTGSFTITNGSQLISGGYPGLIYDEANDTFLAFLNTSPITIRRVSWTGATSMTVDTPSISGTLAQRTNGIQGSVQYVPELKAVVIANSYTGPVKMMRVAS